MTGPVWEIGPLGQQPERKGEGHGGVDRFHGSRGRVWGLRGSGTENTVKRPIRVINTQNTDLNWYFGRGSSSGNTFGKILPFRMGF